MHERGWGKRVGRRGLTPDGTGEGLEMGEGKRERGGNGRNEKTSK